MATIRIATSSRYRSTSLHQDVDLLQYGTYQPPAEFEDVSPGNYATYVVAVQDVGFLDKIAVRFYGPGTEAYWWVICRVNGIVDVETDLWPGRKLVIPPLSAVSAFKSRR